VAQVFSFHGYKVIVKLLILIREPNRQIEAIPRVPYFRIHQFIGPSLLLFSAEEETERLYAPPR